MVVCGSMQGLADSRSSERSFEETQCSSSSREHLVSVAMVTPHGEVFLSEQSYQRPLVNYMYMYMYHYGDAMCTCTICLEYFPQTSLSPAQAQTATAVSVALQLSHDQQLVKLKWNKSLGATLFS